MANISMRTERSAKVKEVIPLGNSGHCVRWVYEDGHKTDVCVNNSGPGGFTGYGELPVVQTGQTA
jgi:hypothetical protein